MKHAYFNKKLLTFVCVIVISYELFITAGISSYFVYAFVAVLGLKYVKFNKQECPILAFLFISIICIFHIETLDKRLFLDSVLTIIGVLPFMNDRKVNVNIKILNYWAYFVFCVVFVRRLSESGFSELMQDLLYSDLATESMMLSFIFPFFALYYFVVKRNNKMLIMNFFMTVVAGKRIALIGLIASILIFYISTVWKKAAIDKTYTYIPLVAFFANMTYLVFSYFLAFGLFDDMIFDVFGRSANHFTMGRQEFYYALLSSMDLNNIDNILFGIGSIYQLAFFESDGSVLLHNDILKIFVETGLFVFMVFIYMLYYNCSITVLPFIIYLNFLLLTDNVSIYIPVLFFFSLFIRIANHNYIARHVTPLNVNA